jgi:hypothetical protein
MENKKQSSIEWLIEQMIKYELVPKGIHFDNILFHQAKAMHQQEIEEAYGHGQNNGYMYAHQKAITISKENYFNQTFGGQDNE